MENIKQKISLLGPLLVSILCPAQGATPDSPRVRMISLSAGWWGSTTDWGYQTIREHFLSLPKLNVLASAYSFFLNCEAGGQLSLRDDGFEAESRYGGSDLSCQLSGGRNFKWKLGTSFPLYQPGTPPSDPYLGTGNIFGLLGWSYGLPLTLEFLPGKFRKNKLDIYFSSQVALDESLTKPGSFSTSTTFQWTVPFHSHIKSGLALGYTLEFWRWAEDGAGEEWNQNLTLSLPMRLRLGGGHALNVQGGWLAWNFNRRDANGMSFSPEISGYFLGLSWEYWL